MARSRPATRSHAAAHNRKGALTASLRSTDGGRVTRRASQHKGGALPHGILTYLGSSTRRSPAPKKRESNRSIHNGDDKRDGSRKTVKRPASGEVTKPPTKSSKLVTDELYPKKVNRARPKSAGKTGPEENNGSSSRQVDTDKMQTRSSAREWKPVVISPATQVVNHPKGPTVKSQVTKTTSVQAKKSSVEPATRSKVQTSPRTGTENGKGTGTEKATSKPTDKPKTTILPVGKGSKLHSVTKTRKANAPKRIKHQREQKATKSKPKTTTVSKVINRHRAPITQTCRTVAKTRKQLKTSTSKAKKTTVAVKRNHEEVINSETKKKAIALKTKSKKQTITKAITQQRTLMPITQTTATKTRKQRQTFTSKIKKTTVSKKRKLENTITSETKKKYVEEKTKKKRMAVKTKKTVSSVLKKGNLQKAITPTSKKKTVTPNTKQVKRMAVKTKKTVSAVAKKRNLQKAITSKAKRKTFLPKTNQMRSKAKGDKNVHPNSKLTPNLIIKEVARDPMFEVRNEKEIPKVSDYVNCKRAIRAVLTKDRALLKKLIANTQEVPLLFVKRSVRLQEDALDYAVKTESLDAMKMLIEEKYNQDESRRKPMPSVPDLSEFKGVRGDYIEGNGALTKDVDNENKMKNIVRFEKALTHGVSLEAIQLLHEGTGYDCTGMIFHAVRAGHHKLAGQMMRTFKGRRGNGFVKLHEEVLMATTPTQLTSFKADLVTKQSYKNQKITPLHCAAVNPNPKILAKMLSASPDIWLTDQAGFTPIHYAAACKTSGPLQLLLKSGASPDDPQPKKLVTPLMIAAKCGRPKNLQVLLKAMRHDASQPKRDKVAVDRKDRRGHYAIHHAAEGGHVDCVRILIKHGAAVEAKESWKNHKITSLMVASERGHFQLAKVLIEELGAEIEKRDKFKRTSLMLACMNGHYPVATVLLRNGADPNAKDSSGNTPLHYAAAYGWWHCLKLLLIAGGNPHIFNDGGYNNTSLTPLGAAYMKCHTGCSAYLLSNAAVDVDQRDDTGATLLLTACRKPRTEESVRQIQLLVKCGADIHAAERFGGCSSVLKYFLAEDSCVPLDADLSGNNPLHWIAGNCRDDWAEVIELIAHNEKSRSSCPLGQTGERTQKDTGAKIVTLQTAARMKDKKGCTPFLRCIADHLKGKWCKGKESIKCSSWYATLKALIDICKSDINARTEEDQEKIPGNSCALHILASQEPSDVLSMVLALKPELDAENAQGYTPLLCAIDARQTENVKTLLAAGAKPNSSNKRNALLLAVKQNMPNIIPDLIARGADVHGSVFKNEQPSIMHYLPVYIKSLESQLAAAKELVSAGASVTAVDGNDRTALHFAVNMVTSGWSGRFVQFLLDHKLDATAADKLGNVPLHHAFLKYKTFDQEAPIVDSKSLSHDPIDTVTLLVDAMGGADLNVRNVVGTTPLHFAAMVGAIQSVKYLAERVDDLNIQNKHGYTPLSMAVIHSKQSVAKWLIEKGATLNLTIDFTYGKRGQTGQKIQCSIFQEMVHEDWQDILTTVIDKIARSEITWISYLDALEVVLSEGRLQLADELIHKLPEPYTLKSTNDKGQNLLHLLAIHVEGGGDIQDKIVGFLLDSGVNLCETDQKGCTPLHYAAVNMNVEFCNIFAKKDPTGFKSCITCADCRGRVPLASLFWGLLFNERVTEILKLIREHNGSLDVCTAFPNVSLAGMKQLTRSESLQEWYHDLPAERTVDVTPLIFMILTNNFAGCQLLLQNGADPNAGDKNGMTALMHAVKQSEITLVLLLMDHAYEPEKAGMRKIKEEPPRWTTTVAKQEEKLPWTTSAWDRMKSGSTIAVQGFHGYERDDKPDDQPEVPNGSLTSHLDVNAADLLCRTAVHHAMMTCDYGTYENAEMLELLARGGARLSERDQQGKTPLDYSMESGSNKMAAALLKLTGVDPAKQGNTMQELKLAPPTWSDGIDFPTSKSDIDGDAKAMVGILEAERGKTRSAEDLRCEEVVLKDEEQNIPYQVTMTKVEVRGKMSSYQFYNMKLIELFSGAIDLVCRFGNIGRYGEHNRKYFHKRKDAIAEFKRIFKHNSGNDWEDVQRFQSKPRKFTLIESRPWTAKRSEAIRDFHFDLTSSVPSKLPKEIQNLLCVWTKPEALRDALKETKVDTAIMNFSNLSLEVLQKANDVLDKISTLIEEKDSQAVQGLLNHKKRLVFAKELYDLSNHYLHDLIPYEDFTAEGVTPIVDNGRLKEHRKTLFDLQDLETINRILMGATYRKQVISDIPQDHCIDADSVWTVQNMNPLDYIYRALGCKLKLMDKDDEEMQHILQYIRHTSGKDTFEIEAIFRVSPEGQNEQLQSCHLDNHKLLWHGCNSANLLSTMKLGLPVALRERVPDWCNLRESMQSIFSTPSFERAVSDGRMFGQTDSKFVFLLEAALGKSVTDSICNVVKNGFDSAYWPGYARINSNKELLLPTGCLLPIGRLCQVPQSKIRSTCSWYVVPNKEQVCLRYLVQVKCTKP